MSLFMSFKSLAEISGSSASVIIFFTGFGLELDEELLEYAEEMEVLAATSLDDLPDARMTVSGLLRRFGMLEVSIGAERSFRISPPSFFCISRASIASIGPMFCLVLSNVPGSSVLAGLSSAIISSVLGLSGCFLKPDLESFCNSRE